MTNCLVNKVTTNQNDMLVQPVEEEEVKRAIFHMYPDKSLGPDDFSQVFTKDIERL